MTSQQQTPQECRTCLANGFPKQMIIFEQLPGLFKADGRPKFKPVNPDNSKHEHKIIATDGKIIGITPPTAPITTTAEPTINMSESQRQSIENSIDNSEQAKQVDREEFYHKREEKYDKNIEEYKAHNKRLETDLGILINVASQTLEQIKNINVAVQSYLHPDPTIQKALDLNEQQITKKTLEVSGLSTTTTSIADDSLRDSQSDDYGDEDNEDKYQEEKGDE